MKKILLACAVAAVAPLMASCASASAKTVDRPALNVPPPPPRVVEPAQEPLPEPVGEIPTSPAAPPASRPNRPSREAAKPPATDPKTESKPADPPKPETAPPTEPVAPVTPPAQLRTPQTADTSGAAKTVQATIDRARGTLNKVDYGPLNQERKNAYNDAKRFIEQAEGALKEGNYVFAQAVANKAETLAKELAGR
jgi:hypothetical protein